MRLTRWAWRNVWRIRRRSVVTIAAMSLALVAMILFAGLIEGYVQGMERSVLDLEIGDLQIFQREYREHPSLYTRIEKPEALLDRLHAAGFRATGRLLAFGLAAAREASAGVSLRGVEVEPDSTVSSIGGEVERGRWLDPRDPKGVVLGHRLARTLGAHLGDEILLLSQAADGSMAYDLYRMRGRLVSIGDAVDRTGVFIVASAFRELMVVPSGVHQILARRPPELGLAQAAQQARRLAPGLDTRTWRQLMPTIASLMDSMYGSMAAMFFLVYVAIGILILNAMLMAVFERIRELGVLKAIGVGPLEVFRLIVLETAIQTGIAIGIGLALGIPALIYLERVGLNMESLAGVSIMGIAMDPVWRAVVSPKAFAGPVFTLVAIVSLAAILPAWKAARISPLEAMRYR